MINHITTNLVTKGLLNISNIVKGFIQIDSYEIVFKKIGFTLYKNGKGNHYIIVGTKDREYFEIDVPLSGYYALKNYYSKGKKSSGKNVIIVSAVLSVAALLLFVVALYVFVLSNL